MKPDTSWLRALYNKKILIVYSGEPYKFDPDYQIDPDGINLRLHPEISITKKGNGQSLDLFHHGKELEKLFEVKRMPSDGLLLQPQQLILAKTLETVAINSNKYLGLVLSRPTVAKLGISIHFIQAKLPPGVFWNYPLQIFNASDLPVKIYPFMYICQLILIEYNEEVSRSYSDGVNVQSENINSWKKGLEAEEERRISDNLQIFEGMDEDELKVRFGEGYDKLIKEKLALLQKQWKKNREIAVDTTSGKVETFLKDCPTWYLALYAALLCYYWYFGHGVLPWGLRPLAVVITVVVIMLLRALSKRITHLFVFVVESLRRRKI